MFLKTLGPVRRHILYVSVFVTYIVDFVDPDYFCAAILCYLKKGDLKKYMLFYLQTLIKYCICMALLRYIDPETKLVQSFFLTMDIHK